MSIWNFFSRTQEKSFVAQQLAVLVKDLPPTLIQDGRGKVSVNKITRHLERVYKAASDFKEAQNIGFMGRAVMANAFKWGLKECGYPDEFADMATEGLVVALSKKASA
ncbi:hypothetical protein WIT60_08545 [Aquabacterium sp. G14]|uniref:hypothetical protein n=1 Tax=Aquabacterium sp. G14 TaxID=3130164 RepID=UPI0030AB617A